MLQGKRCCADGGQVAKVLGTYDISHDSKDRGVSWLFWTNLDSIHNEKDRLVLECPANKVKEKS